MDAPPNIDNEQLQVSEMEKDAAFQNDDQLSQDNIKENDLLREFSRSNITLSCDGFGVIRNDINAHIDIVKRYTWRNDNGLFIQVISYGATILSIKTPDKYGITEDIVMGFENMQDIASGDSLYFGVTKGRLANRLEINYYALSKEILGPRSNFDKVLWNSQIEENKVIMSHLSEDGSEGYPGNLMVSITFELTENNQFAIEFTAICDKATPINITNHLCFNLAGHGAGATEIFDHLLTLNSEKYIAVHQDHIPSGYFKFVEGTIHDFRVPRYLGGALKYSHGTSLEINYCVSKCSGENLSFVARAVHPKSGRVLEVYSDQPCVQFFTGNNLPNPRSIIIPYGIYEDSYRIQSALYQSSVFPNYILDQKYIFSNEDISNIDFRTHLKQLTPTLDEEHLSDHNIPELHKKNEEYYNDEYFHEENSYYNEIRSIQESMQSNSYSYMNNDTSEYRIKETDNSKIAKHKCCNPECYCTFDMECDKMGETVSQTINTNISVVTAPDIHLNSIMHDTQLVITNKGDYFQKEEKPKDKFKKEEKDNDYFDKEEKEIEISNFSPTGLDKSDKITGYKMNINKNISPNTSKAASVKSSAISCVRNTHDVYTKIIESSNYPVEVQHTKTYKNCDEHFVDITEMEPPTHDITYSGLKTQISEIRGKLGARYRKHGAICLETQNFPESVNQQMLSSLLIPGQIYKHKIVYQFDIRE